MKSNDYKRNRHKQQKKRKATVNLNRESTQAVKVKPESKRAFCPLLTNLLALLVGILNRKPTQKPASTPLESLLVIAKKTVTAPEPPTLSLADPRSRRISNSKPESRKASPKPLSLMQRPSPILMLQLRTLLLAFSFLVCYAPASGMLYQTRVQLLSCVPISLWFT